jgi:molecular chaperone DnaJ
VLRLKGRGVKRGEQVGDLLARVQVVVPQRLTDEARAAIETMAAAEDAYDPRAELFQRARS